MRKGYLVRKGRGAARRVKKLLEPAQEAAEAPEEVAAPVRKRAASAHQVDGVSYLVSAKSAKVTGIATDTTALIIPDSVRGRPVTVLGKAAFKNNTALTSVTLPSSITTLGVEAFAGCTALESVELPSDLEVINARAFEGCTRLTTVHLPYALTRIAQRAFAGCTALESLPHYVKTGISAGMTVDRNVVEQSLPTSLTYVGEEAFHGCAALRKVVVPYRVTSIRRSTFAACTSLETVWLHSRLTAIGERAFAGCSSLRRLSVPVETTSIGSHAIESATTIVCAAGSPAHEYATGAQVPVDTARLPDEPVVSMLGSGTGLSAADVLAAPELTQTFVDHYDVRPAADEVARDDTASNATPIAPSRFALHDGVYRPVTASAEGDVSISMVGDLMCRVRQQRSALQDGVYDFTGSFTEVRPVLAASDLAIGNMETMVSASYPYMHETAYIDDRPHLNSPFAYLAAVRSAGFDVVMNAQNHMYDTGTKGVFETLDALNRADLIHSGMYAGPSEPRYLLFEIKGITIGVVSYLDGARQKMKQANFTDEGLAVIASHFDADRIEQDIAAARAAGAEFVLAYCHWGREYTDQITRRQENFARMVVDGGADYVFGSHSHCPQPYTIKTSKDGRSVPVVYSGGNLISDIGLKKPITQDAFVSRLTLGRDRQGAVIIKDDGYIPFRILEDRTLRGYVRAVPCDQLTDGGYGYNPITAVEDVRRITGVMGMQYRQLTVDGSPVAAASATEPHSGDDELVVAYALREPSFVRRQPSEPSQPSGFTFDEPSGLWRRESDTAEGEAVIICGGSILYDSAMERRGHVGDTYQFRSLFTHVRDCVSTADLAVGSLGAVVADMYPPMALMPQAAAGGHYVNARPEYLDALRFAGFDCLALANPFNLDAGVRGVSATERAVLDHGQVPSGIGARKNPIFDVNGIKVAVLSFTLNEYNARTYITDEGADRILNVFDAARVRRTVAEVRASGAQFVLAYLDCRAASDQPRFADRLKAGQQLADGGADYVICTQPHVLSKQRTHRTADGRTVPIATGIGSFMAGPGNHTDTPSALVKLVLRPTADGTIEVDDSYIPLQRRRSYHGALNPVVPALAAYNTQHKTEEFATTLTELAERLGDEIEVERSRKVRISTHYRPQLTPAQISDLLGTEFSPDAAAALKPVMSEPVYNIVTRKGDLHKGSVAVVVEQISYQRGADQMTIDDAVRAGALMAVAPTPSTKLPTLVHEHPWQAFATLAGAIRDAYSPVTVAITGTAGKTTAKELMSLVFNRHYRTLAIEGNNNTLATVGLILQKLSADDEAYVQEVHGGSIGAASSVSRVIKPDVCLITNIGDGHLGQMGSIENVIEGKMQITDGLRPGGVLVVNHDNEYLREQHPDLPTIRYSTHDRECDYYARNITDTGERLEFEIVSPDGIFDARLNFLGLHNVSNALGVFAASRAAGVPPHKIIAGLSRYAPDSVRQNLVEVGGYQLLLDTYSSTPMSVVSAAETLAAIPLADGAQRVAVVGDIPDQGAKSRQNHTEVGAKLAELDLDVLLCYGDDTRYTIEAARAQGMNAYHFTDRREFNRMIAEVARPGDAVLFKGGTRVKLLEETVIPLFGRVV